MGQGRMPRLSSPVRGVLLGVTALMAALGFTRMWDDIERKAFDAMTVLSAPQRSVLPITIIGIDEPSFAQVGQRWPWPRSLHARLVDRLAEAGAAVIAFDIVFAEASVPAEDAAFAAAIGRAGNVVLAADHAFHETAFFRQWLRVDPLLAFTEAGALPGLATIELDADGVARQAPQGDDALWRQAIRAFQRARPGVIPGAALPEGALIRHLGAAHTFPYISYYQALNGDASIPPDFFRDQIVLIGRDVRSSPEAGAAHADMFPTPFLAGSRVLTPGVEIHATLIENAIAGMGVAPAPVLPRLRCSLRPCSLRRSPYSAGIPAGARPGCSRWARRPRPAAMGCSSCGASGCRRSPP